jgi:hypothetical protein
LEIQQQIKVTLPDCPTECRFCNSVYSNKSKLNQHHKICKEKVRYFEKLNVFNLNDEQFGPELPEILVDYMRETINLGGESFDYIRAVKWIIKLHNEIIQNSQNKNIRLAGAKAMSTEIFTNDQWVKMYTDNAVDQVFKVRSGQLVGLKESINDHNDLVFQAPTVQRTMKHVEKFEQHGWEHRGKGQDTRRCRSEFKVNLI